MTSALSRSLAVVPFLAGLAYGQTASLSVVPQESWKDAQSKTPWDTDEMIPVLVTLDITSLGVAGGVDAIDLNFTGSDPLLEIVDFALDPALSFPAGTWDMLNPAAGVFTLFNLGAAATGSFDLGEIVVRSAIKGDYLLTLDSPILGNPTDATGIDPGNPIVPVHFGLTLGSGIVRVPEPATLALFAAGAVALSSRRRERRS